MNLGKLQDGEHGKRKKACGNRKKKKKLIDNDDFSRYLYVTQMKHTPIFLNENRKKRRKLCAYYTKTCVKIITYIDKVQNNYVQKKKGMVLSNQRTTKERKRNVTNN